MIVGTVETTLMIMCICISEAYVHTMEVGFLGIDDMVSCRDSHAR